jgi:PPK2 family polyphosphate:nucleotide phosphotransferase
MQLAWKVAEGSSIKLEDYDPNYIDEHTDPALARAELEQLGNELSELQELLAAAHHQSLLIVLQGMDASGKAETIQHVFSHINPQGCEVHSFKVPTPQEMDHDFLWRVHRVTPGRGVIGIFDRSHYEVVLVVRVHNLQPEEVWRRHYAAINDFERLLVQHDMIILKFFLHLSKDEQERRLLAQQRDRTESWKLSTSDWIERRYWDEYQTAYEEALAKCSTEDAPWYIVPANHQWYRNVLVARTLATTLRQYKDRWEAQLIARGEEELALLAKRGHEGQDEKQNHSKTSGDAHDAHSLHGDSSSGKHRDSNSAGKKNYSR